ncbi:SDR family oxidoreductase [Xanthobacter autotrophicus]|uniref:SDR family oxidoreductase n=1 Tax=Xanthobacter TaxID=279 RepID=UPI0024AC4B4E|nr:SDR family oxidoreductase [Xanthobacter autotrophicus]MDI4663557.1 SDR family oxidoreductase [Xanthobacter autotrophicus]
MDLGITGIRVVITAGAGGIGLEMARAFAREGARVEVCDVDQAALAALPQTAPGVTGSTCDVSDRAAVARFMDTALDRLGGLDVLVNNAGIAGPTGRVDQIAPEDWDRTLAVDITGHFNVTRLAVPALKQSANASIIGLASAAGRFGFPLRSPYAAAKWGVVGFIKSLSMELGEFGIRANAILPGSVDGPRIQSVFENKARERNLPVEEVQAMALSATSLKRLIPPQHLANVAVFLASPLGSTISGQAIAVDGDLQMLV